MFSPADQSHAVATQAFLNPPMNGLVDELLAFMAQADAGEQAFNNLALKLFAHQFEFNVPFQRFCRQRARTPRTVRRWQDIPAVPIAAFKEQTLSCWPPEQCERVFMTVGPPVAMCAAGTFTPICRCTTPLCGFIFSSGL
jgi:hypothetical protein